ncbi:MAG TPA: hypothetical protein VF695_11250 [Sphingomonas sp.]
MRTVLLALLLTGTAAQAQFAPSPRVPAPRPANPFGTPALPPAPSTGLETREIRDRIDDGRRSGQLSRREARGLRRQAAGLDLRAEIYGRDGLSEAEQRELAVRARVIRDTTIARRSGIGATPR